MAVRKRTILFAIGIIGLCSLVVAGGSLLAWQYHQNAGILPRDVTPKVAFVVFYPSKDQHDWMYDKQKTTFNSDTGVLTMPITGKRRHITLNQQATPDSFKDIAQQYSRMLTLLQEYSEIRTTIGTVALTRPKELNGGQTAVINTRDTLLFAKPDRDLSNDEWQDFFNQLSLLR